MNVAVAIWKMPSPGTEEKLQILNLVDEQKLIPILKILVLQMIFEKFNNIVDSCKERFAEGIN